MRMTRTIASAAALVSVLTGCTNFLNADKAVQNPNNPTTATTGQLFVGVQANIFGQQEGPVAMIVCEWMQQCAGVNGRFVDQQGVYGITAGSFDGSFQSIYTGGGLLQIKQVEKQADAAGDKVTKGMAEVLEAMNMMFGADIWGDLPYSEAAGTITTPKFDPQMTVYATLLTLLTNAIADLKGAGGPNPA